MSGTFFVDWALWQQMSFCLACAIVTVMLAGVCRLQYLNWKSKKLMLEDEEKKARLSEIRSTGLRVRRDNDIPFGVRAIESGIEVDGIWISRPTTPATPADKPFASVTTLVTDEQQGKGKERDMEGQDSIDTASAAASPRLSPSDYRPRQPSSLRNGATGDSDGLRSVDPYVPYSDYEQQDAGYQPPGSQNSYYSRPARDYSPSMSSSRGNACTPDLLSNGPHENSMSGFPAEYTDGVSTPSRTFAPGQQSHWR